MQHKIILIAGIGHSGSTLLDRVLGCHPRIVGLGEVSKVLRTPLAELREGRYRQSDCSCGALASECPFWSDFLDWLEANHRLSLEEKYTRLLLHFRQQFGSDILLLDSSKTVRPYQAWLHHQHELRAIFLARDIRSWVYSRLTGHDARDKGGTLRLAARWWRGMRRTERFLDRHGIPRFQLGYEELAIQPERMLARLCDWLGLELDPAMLTPANTGSHIIRGNRTHRDTSRRSAIRYDARWMRSSRLMLQSPLLLPLAALNRRLVYANITTTDNTQAIQQADRQENRS